MFNFLKTVFTNLVSHITSGLKKLFARTVIDDAALKELQEILIGADTGVKTTKLIIENVQTRMRQADKQDGNALQIALEAELVALLSHTPAPTPSDIYLLVGINGSGKTTCASKLAYKLKNEHKKVLFIAADTFRAAAVDQLKLWAEKVGVGFVQGKENQDPASVVFSGLQTFKSEGYDAVIIDTAGRLQTKVNLMKELEKIKRVITTQLPDRTITTLLTVDAMLGQNSLEQARIFNESTSLSGVILTKMDGTGKGGIVFAISHELNIPILSISFGEQMEQLKAFNAQEYVHHLLHG